MFNNTFVPLLSLRPRRAQHSTTAAAAMMLLSTKRTKADATFSSYLFPSSSFPKTTARGPLAGFLATHHNHHLLTATPPSRHCVSAGALLPFCLVAILFYRLSLRCSLCTSRSERETSSTVGQGGGEHTQQSFSLAACLFRTIPVGRFFFFLVAL